MPLPTLHTAANPVIEVDLNGLPIDSQVTTSGRSVVGNVASGSTDAGNPVKVGGRFISGGLNLTSGQRGDLQLNAKGSLLTTVGDGTNIAAINFASSDGIAFNTVSALLTIGQGVVWNGTSFDRMRGDTTGTFVHAPTNSVSTALSGTIATSGTTVTVAFINTVRQEIINPSASTLWASWGTPAVNGPGSFPIAPGGSFSTDRTAGTLTVLSTAATQPYTVNRYS